MPSPPLRRLSFLNGAFLHRLTSVLADRASSPLLRAVLGPAAKKRPEGASAWTVLDGTAGYGRDALTLAAAGASHVLAVERHPTVAALLAESLEEAAAACPGGTPPPGLHPQAAKGRRIVAAAAARVTLLPGIATEDLLVEALRARAGLPPLSPSTPPLPPVDVMYLDPMFAEGVQDDESGAGEGAKPLKRRGAPGGEMVALEAVAGAGPSRSALAHTLALGLAVARHAVVIKRHVRAAPLPLSYADVCAAVTDVAGTPSIALLPPPPASVSMATYGGKHAVRLDVYRLLVAAAAPPAPAAK